MISFLPGLYQNSVRVHIPLLSHRVSMLNHFTLLNLVTRFVQIMRMPMSDFLQNYLTKLHCGQILTQLPDSLPKIILGLQTRVRKIQHERE
jgi:hypothetical protein